ncbi:caveolin-2 [Latimeria chalumnae]|uniref:caveolin-2 n=1 Tax=Latimeria chalumnae TaxID=7897 RepID=UPI0003C14064|nr:PREDICTED: caveolin-2-like [Latimeria chalumnae]|eukprot:XP_005988000.1 PREDICTED: caveolin-2-like [Latimeria chalumnae]
MIKEDYLEETKIDLEDEKQFVDQDIPSQKTTSAVENRDPKGINKHLKVSFEEVIAEPDSIHSFDRVWIWSHALFEVSRLWCYRIISLILAVPISLVSGILFAIISCLHIWCVVPCIKTFLMNMPAVQTIWGTVLDIVISPFCKSMGRCFSGINFRIARD